MWVQKRSKMSPDAEPYGGLGTFGSDMQTFAPQCFLGSKYYDFLQSSVHPDRNSQGYPYCCCVDMITGLTVGTQDDCRVGSFDGNCGTTCLTDDHLPIIEEVMKEQAEMLDRI